MMMAKSTVLAFVAAACAVGGAEAFGVTSAAVQLRGSSFASAASAARPVQVPLCLDTSDKNVRVLAFSAADPGAGGCVRVASPGMRQNLMHWGSFFRGTCREMGMGSCRLRVTLLVSHARFVGRLRTGRLVHWT